jgi:hypothetical protein
VSSVTGLTSYVTKLTFAPTPSPMTGTFKLEWYAEYNHDKTNGNTEVQLLRTDVPSTVGFASERITDASNWNIFSGHQYFTFSGSSPSFDLNFRTDTLSNTASVQRVRLDLFKVAP